MKNLDPKHPAYEKIQAAEGRLREHVKNTERLKKKREAINSSSKQKVEFNSKINIKKS